LFNTSHNGEKYQIQQLISSTEIADVYLAYIEGIGGFKRQIAIKKYHSISDEDLFDLTNDAKQSGLLSHANVVQVWDLGEWDNSWFLAMEYVEGHSLGYFLTLCKNKRIKMPTEIVVYVVVELLTGLEYAHNRRSQNNKEQNIIIHQNLEPSNILINNQGNVKIKGFSHKCRQKNDSPYMPPDLNFDHRTDIWSVGAVLQALLYGIDNLDPRATMTASEGSPIERIMQQAIHPDPSRRFQSARAMKEAIFNQCGEISMNAAQKLSEFIRVNFPENYSTNHKDASDLPTYVSKTVSKHELENDTTQETSLRQFQVKGIENIQDEKIIPNKESTSLLQMVLLLLIFVVGILVGALSIGFNIKEQAELRLYFPTEVSVSINGESVISSGSRITVVPEKPVKAIVSFADGTKRELDVQLSAGESRIIYIEHLKLQ
jgi:serine/threonine protein kinase